MKEKTAPSNQRTRVVHGVRKISHTVSNGFPNFESHSPIPSQSEVGQLSVNELLAKYADRSIYYPLNQRPEVADIKTGRGD